ncbi:hypothetical protein CVD28_01270 [Bacillus sp. M6-12]|uniref:hypothetical protein n=1 Tax=Bacillus sp. M6-12 TaxID=2054166 RepID=UPI000C78AA2A|nr:hypothetical protein [Bacillus sp. M6-12]PLS19064.1 hypothetical protein CVD28_01270 [Bacillus sp. M6-12]
MNEKESKGKFLTFFLIIAVVALTALIMYNLSNEDNKYYDILPGQENKDVLIAHADNITNVSHTKYNSNDRFYVDIEDKKIDEGIFYEPKNKNIDKGFLIEMNQDGSFSPIY